MARPDAGFDDWTCPNCGAAGRDNIYEEPEGGFECFKCGQPVAPDTEDIKDAYERVPAQTPHTTPFPDRAVKPNRFKVDNSFPSTTGTTNQRGNIPMKDFDHVLAEAQYEASQPSLAECPHCASPMTDHQNEKVCHTCGDRQPVVYAKAAGWKDWVLPAAGLGLMATGIGAPEGAALLGAGALEAGAAGAGEAGLAGGLGGLMGQVGTQVGGPMNAALGAGRLYSGMHGLEDMAQGANGAMGGQPSTQLPPEPAPGVYGSRTAGDDSDDIGGATKNRGDDDNPAMGGTQGFLQNEKADSDENAGDTNDVGGTADATSEDDPMGGGDPMAQLGMGSLEAFEMLLPFVMKFAESPHGGAGNPILMALDQMLESEYPGYRQHPNSQVELVVPSGVNGDPAMIGGPDEEGDDSDSSSDSKPKSESKPKSDSYKKAARVLARIAQKLSFGRPCPECRGTGELGYGDEPCDACGGRGIIHNEAKTANPNMPSPQQMAQLQNQQPQQPMMPDPAGAQFTTDGPCQLCGGNHNERIHGVMPMQMGQPGQMGQTMARLEVVAARRPKMCPYHTDVVDYSLTLGNPQNALSALQPSSYGANWCKSPDFDGKCRFKAPMVTQEYWDQKDADAEQRRQEREQLQQPQVVEVPAQAEAAPEQRPIEVGGDELYDGDATGTSPEPVSGTAVQGMPVAAKWKVADNSHEQRNYDDADFYCPKCRTPCKEKDGECPRCGMDFPKNMNPHNAAEGMDFPEPTDAHDPGAPGDPLSNQHREHVVEDHIDHDHEHHDRSLDWHDQQGSPIREGGKYQLKSPNYEIPDKITVESVTPDKITFTIEGEGGMEYRDELSREDIQNEGYEFEPDGESNDPHQQGHDPEYSDDSEHNEDEGPPEQDDVSDNYARAAHVDYPERNWLFEGSGVDVDEDTLARVHAANNGTHTAGRDYTPREQREFIDETGAARNLSKLDLTGTHYVDDPELVDSFLWGM